MHSPPQTRPKRPLSPHLQVYKPQISSTLSILHRATGVALSLGSLVFAVWLWSIAYGGGMSECIYNFFASTLGQILMIGWSAALYYHLANGIRHLFWDIGLGFTLPRMELTGWLTLAFTLAATALTWLYVYGVIVL